MHFAKALDENDINGANMMCNLDLARTSPIRGSDVHILRVPRFVF